MSLSEVQVRGIARLTFEQPYTMPQLAKLIHSSYREVYDFFRTKRSKGLFNIARPWVEVLEEAAPTLSKGKRTHYKKWVQNPDVLVRLSPKGFDLINCNAKLKLSFAEPAGVQNRQQLRRQERQLGKEVFRKLNYSQQVFNLLESGDLDPSDLPAPGFLGSDKYLSLFPERYGGSEFVDPEGTFADPEEEKNLPAGWTLEGQIYREKADTAHGGAFGACDGLPKDEDLVDFPYSHDLLFSRFDNDMHKKFDPIRWGKCSEERKKAILLVLKNNVKNFGYTVDSKDENGKRKFIPKNQEIYEEIVELFDEYKTRTSDERLVMMPKKDPWAVPLLLPNANRFNDESKKTINRMRYENLFLDASSKYKSAVLLTLTTNQKWHRNVFEANKTFQDNWNRLITRIRKEAKDERIKDLVKKNPEFLRVRIQKNLLEMPGGSSMPGYEFSSDILTPHTEKSLQALLEAAESFQVRTRTARRHEGLQGRNESDSEYFRRIQRERKAKNVTAAELRAAAEDYVKSDNSLKFPYICVREYQKNGNVHYHIILFGRRWLKPKDEISKMWQEYYQGVQVDLHAIRFDSQRGFMWESGSAPCDSEGRQPMEYLKKYLLKGQYSIAAGSMYWLNASRFFTYSQSLLSDEHRPKSSISKGLYEFAGVVNGEYWMDNGDFLICVDTAGPPPGIQLQWKT